MQRRTFLSLAGAMGLQAGSGQLKHYYLRHEREMLQLVKELRADHPDALILEAIAAAHMPQLLVAQTSMSAAPGFSPASVFELRSYRTALTTELNSANIHPIYSSGQTYLIPFASLAAREQAWSAFGPSDAQVTSISIFKPAT